MERTAHIDTFARDNLPPREQWPELIFELPGLRYPGRLNCATELLDRALERGWGPRVALRSPDAEITYAQLLEQANRVARVLTEDMGLVPGNRVLLRGANSPWMAACWLAVMKAGGIAVATMPLLRAKELAEITLKASVTHALCDKRLDSELKATLPACSMLKTVAYWHDGASVVLVEKPTPELILETIAKHKATICFTAPTFYRQMAQLAKGRDLRSLKKCVSAGEALPDATRQMFKRATGIEIVDGIGSTEMIHIFISHTPERVRRGATGYALPGYRAAVLDDEGRPCSAGAIGRLAVKGPTGCRYLADERQRDYVQGGWNMTGDAYTQDGDGYFFYQARTDDMIISAGYNIAGPEVEGALLEHEAVAECGVVGVPDEDRGQVVKAYVVLKAGYAKSDALARSLQDHVKRAIAPYKYPRRVEFVDALPRTETGKLQRFKLRERA